MTLKATLRRLADGHGFWTILLNLRRVAEGHQPIFLDYPVEAVPRYGHGKPPHPELSALLAEDDREYAEKLSQFLSFAEGLRQIPLKQSSDSMEPCWINDWLDGLDTLALYAFVAGRNASKYIEIGSGYSTKVAKRAIKDRALRTKITSIDPHPRAEIDRICDEVIRQPLEKCDLNVFYSLTAGDILFLDGSHRSFMNSDVTVFFLEILPRLKPGVLVHLHDIFLPEDYPPYWELRFYPHRYWSEQYLLAASLLAGHAGYEVVLPNYYISKSPQVSGILSDFWSGNKLAGVRQGGCSFWLQTR